VKRLLRITSNALTALSLLLFVTVMIFWLISYRSPAVSTSQHVHYHDLPGPASRHLWSSWICCSQRGVIGMARTTGDEPAEENIGSWGYARHQFPSRVPVTLLKAMTETNGFSHTSHTQGGVLSRYQLDWVDWSLIEHNVVWGIWTERIHFWIVSYWLFALITGTLPCLWCLRRCVPARRRREGHCPVCNYDLRATPGRCPECGTIPPAPVRA
jgi:hypothetical protein